MSAHGSGGAVHGSDAVLFLIGLTVAAASFILVVFGVNRLVAPHAPDPVKLEPFECGMPPAGRPWTPVHLRFSTIALLFVLFDAETALLFAVASRLRGSIAGLIEVAAFSAMLAFGLYYAWRKGALEWPS